jgi:iron complex transport system substrate-binding protein
MDPTRQVLAVALAVLLLTAGAVGVAGTAAAQADSGECDYPLTVTDATGTEVTIEEAPERVVTLAPSAAQTMWEIGAREKVVGISGRATYLNDTDGLPIISNEDGVVSTEQVVAQEPDVVLAPDIIGDDKIDQLREANLTVYNFAAATSLDDVADKTRLTGQLVGACEGANARADTFEETVSTVESALEGVDRPSVLYLLGGEFTAGANTYIHSVLETAGGTNVAAEAGISGYGQISREVVANASPEYIVVSSGAPEVIPDAAAYNDTPAVQNDQIVTVDANYLNQPAPRTSLVLEALASEFHPDAYQSGGEGLEQSTPVETTAADAPGFGPLLALVAVLGAALFARREP